jgi:prevent-host-death family protein
VGQTVSKSKFKAKALEYLRAVEQCGEELVITDRGRPVVKVVPLNRDPDALLAPFRGTLIDYEEPTEPVASEDWEVLA